MTRIQGPRPVSILKAPKKVTWGYRDVRYYDLEMRPLLDTHEVARREMQIRQTPPIQRVQQPKAQPIRRPQKPKWTWWQKLLRGRSDVLIFGLMATALVGGAAGPFCLLVPLAIALYYYGAHLYRKHGPQAEDVLLYQQFKAEARREAQKIAKEAKESGDLREARRFEYLQKRLK